MPHELNEQTDLLNQVLKDAETALAELGLGVQASIGFQVEGVSLKLAFKRKRLYVDDLPLAETSRQIRVCVAKFLPALHASMLRAAEQNTLEVREAIQAVEAFIDSLEDPDEA